MIRRMFFFSLWRGAPGATRPALAGHSAAGVGRSVAQLQAWPQRQVSQVHGVQGRVVGI
jgi:hypothetical protein